MQKIVLIGTLDTKGNEFLYLKKRIEEKGYPTVVIDCGVVGAPGFEPDIDRSKVAGAAGTTIEEIIAADSTANAMALMAEGAKMLVRDLYDKGEICGAISLGGGQGTFIGLKAMEGLPLGFPKVMVSTLARAVKEIFDDCRDTVVIDPIVDISGLNSILKYSLDMAAATITGICSGKASITRGDRKVIAITMFGVTSKCAERIKDILEKEGFEVWIFHCNGIGGRNMEQLIENGMIDGVIDLTTSEVGQTMMGGSASCIETRMEAAGRMGIPQVISLGALDAVNFGKFEEVPSKYREDPKRRFHMHNPSTTIMRTEACDYEILSRIFAGKVNKAEGKVKVIIPEGGISKFDSEGGCWFDPETDRVLIDKIVEKLDKRIDVERLPEHINDEKFALRTAEEMMQLMKG